MTLPEEAELLRIFVGESDKHHGRPIYEAIVEEARRKGLAGATVLRATLGFGAHSRIHTAKILRLSEDLPMVIEIVDKPDRIAAFLPDLDQLMDEGLVTLENVRVITYRHSEKKKKSRDSTNSEGAES
jgi:PII-like signaling protein